MSNTIRNRIRVITGSSEEYTKEIVDDLIDDSAARERLAKRSRSRNLDDPEKAAVPPKDPANPKPATKQPAAKVDKGKKLYVRPMVRPLARQQDDLNDLASQGYSLDIVLRRARQQTQRRFKLNPAYVPAAPDDETSGKAERINVVVAKADLEALSKQAGDLGTMPYTQLIAAQVQKIWVEELDAIITNLKRKVL